MADYFKLSFVEDSPVQHPEKLYREPRMMALLTACCIVLAVMSFVNLPWLGRVFPKSGTSQMTHPRAVLSISQLTPAPDAD
jgi:hypothetical protein